MPKDEAQRLVDAFLGSIQILDNTLISSVRSQTPVPESTDQQVDQAVQDLDRSVNLCTIPAELAMPAGTHLQSLNMHRAHVVLNDFGHLSSHKSSTLSWL